MAVPVIHFQMGFSIVKQPFFGTPMYGNHWKPLKTPISRVNLSNHTCATSQDLTCATESILSDPERLIQTRTPTLDQGCAQEVKLQPTFCSEPTTCLTEKHYAGLLTS